MDFDKNCKWHNDCGADMCHGEGVCPDFEKKLELLPCPFCGGVPSCRDNGEWNKVYDSGGAIVDVDISDPDVFIVECSCGAQIISDESEETVYKAWNRRTREGGCKYCKTPPEHLAICQNYETRIFVGISGEYLQIFDEDYPGFCDNHKINFCPICGRKLS